jgi:hypothetical protein
MHDRAYNVYITVQYLNFNLKELRKLKYHEKELRRNGDKIPSQT